METLLTWLIAWWIFHLLFQRWVSSPFPFVKRCGKFLSRVVKRIWYGIAHVAYHRQAQRRGAGFGLLHACFVWNLFVTIWLLAQGNKELYPLIVIGWLVFLASCLLYSRHQHFKRSRQQRHRLPGRHRR